MARSGISPVIPRLDHPIEESSRMRRVVSVTPVLLCVPALLSAQSHPLAGTWNVDVPAGMRVENDVATPIMAKGVLSLQVQGDSLVGTLAVEPPAGRPARPASRLAARLAPQPVVFVQSTQATVNVNGSESTRRVTSTFNLTASGDSLHGTVDRRVQGEDGMSAGPLPLAGARAKSPS